MHVAELSLRNVRRLRTADLALVKGVNLLIGANAQGKTTALEALHYLATTTSHRTRRHTDLIAWGEKTALLTATVCAAEGGCTELGAELARSKRPQFALARSPCTTREALGHLAVVFFSAEDLQLIKSGPGIRRRFLNLALGQMAPRYVDDLARYRRALRQRNAVIAQCADTGRPSADLASWTEALIRYATPLIRDRQRFVTDLAPSAARLHAGLAGRDEHLELRYRCQVPEEHRDSAHAIAEALRERYERTQATDLSRRATQAGPHRDDLVIRIDGRAAREFASQGQQRTAGLALRLAEVGLATQRLGDTPVLLLDDVMSELDPHRASQVLDLAGEVEQIIVTSTQLPDAFPPAAQSARTFEVIDGRVERVARRAENSSGEHNANGED